MRLLVSLLASILLIGVPAGAQQAIQSNQFLITPGAGIGPLRLGMTIEEAVQLLGTPKSTKTFSNGATRYRWYEYVALPSGYSTVRREEGGLYTQATSLGVVYQVGVFENSSYLTPEGLHVGSPEQEVYRVMGRPEATNEETGGGGKSRTFLQFPGDRILCRNRSQSERSL